MQHQLPLTELRSELGPRADGMAKAVERCVHCGFCLATCPTYLTLGEEMDSPRGRIILMKEVLEGELDLDASLNHIDPCLGCLACETSCPSGVEYGHLLQPFRAWAEPRRSASRWRRIQRAAALMALSSPSRFRWLARLGQVARPLGRGLPAPLRASLDLLPRRLEPRYRLPERAPFQGPRRARVALLAGCAQQVLAPDIHRATIEVLSRNGIEVLVPKGQGCCGALALHAGDEARARDLASKNLRAFDCQLLDRVDAVVTNTAGCGSGLRESAELFLGTADETAAKRLASSVRDVSVVLDELGLVDTPPALDRTLRVAYQDACHLAHAQGVKGQPRRLLRSIGNLELVDPASSEVCCGSAGTYNLSHPEIAADLGRRKAASLVESGAKLVASGNIGCIAQLRSHLDLLGASLPVRHTMQILRDAYRQELD